MKQCRLDPALSIGSLHRSDICGESLDLELKYARIIVHKLFDAFSILLQAYWAHSTQAAQMQ